MAKAKDISGEEAARPADLGRVDDAAAETSSAQVNPLLTSFAAATAFGFSLASQMAGAMLGSMQGAMEATSKLARTLEEERKASGEPPQAEPEPPKPDAPAVAEAVADVKPKAAARKASTKAAAKPVTPAAKAKTSKPAAAPVAEVVEAKPAKAPARKKAVKADDLKKIAGVGPKVEQVLNGMGVSRFAEIAAWSAEDIARFDEALGFAGRIEKDGWVAQAKALAGGKG